jgi:hypothetical protein
LLINGATECTIENVSGFSTATHTPNGNAAEFPEMLLNFQEVKNKNGP